MFVFRLPVCFYRATSSAQNSAPKMVHAAQDASPQELVGLKGIAASAVADFIRSPDVYQFDLMESPAVRQLEGDAQDGPLLELLSTILDGDVQVLN